MKNILITGATGLIGSQLVPALQAKGFKVSILSRSKQEMEQVDCYQWDIAKGILPQKAIDQADAIIHLAGANVGSERWTPKRKEAIVQSRVDSAELLLEGIKKSNTPPSTFVTASAVGYYGMQTSEKIFRETDPASDDFFGHVGKAWESVLEKTTTLNIRSVALRVGVVLDREEGALPKMAMPLKFGFGTPIGSGKQYIPWIHIEDIVSLFVKAVEDTQLQGAYNAAAPEHVNNKDFMKTLCAVKKRLFIPIGAPAIFLKLALGEMAGIVLEGSRVSSDKIVKTGFQYKFPELESALRDLVSK